MSLELKSSSKVVIIILNYNGLTIMGPRLLYRNLKSVLNTDYERFNVVYVDNGSSDASIDFILKYFAKYIDTGTLSLLKLNRNYGWSGGNNRGAVFAIKKYDPEYLVFLNNDVYISEEDWLRKIINTMKKYNLDLSSPIIYELKLRKHVLGDEIDGVGRSRPIIVSEDKLMLLRRKNIEVIPVTFLHGAALIVKRSVYESVGGFDEGFRAYYDESDFCMRAMKMGFKAGSIIGVIVEHHGGMTINYLRKPVINPYVERVVESSMRFTRKHYGVKAFLSCMLNNIKWLLAELYKKNLGNALGVVRGLIQGLKISSVTSNGFRYS